MGGREDKSGMEISGPRVDRRTSDESHILNGLDAKTAHFALNHIEPRLMMRL